MEPRFEPVEEIKDKGFGPITSGDDILKLPSSLNTTFVGSHDEIHLLKSLDMSPMVGLDAESQIPFSPFCNSDPQIFQISDSENAFIVDMAVLGEDPLLDEVLFEIFSSNKTLFLWFNQSHFRFKFEKIYSEKSWYRVLNSRLIDIQKEYMEITSQTENTWVSQAEVIAYLNNSEMKMCQDEKISNWSQRPLRKSQEYYAALDAFSLLKAAEQLADKDPDSALADKIQIVQRGEGIEYPQMDFKSSMSSTTDQKKNETSQKVVGKEMGRKTLKIIAAINECVQNTQNFEDLQRMASPLSDEVKKSVDSQAETIKNSFKIALLYQVAKINQDLSQKKVKSTSAPVQKNETTNQDDDAKKEEKGGDEN